jgi:hypothetical protein
MFALKNCLHQRIKRTWQLDMVKHTHNLSTQETEAGGSKFEANLGYVMSSRLAGAT